MNLPSTDEVWFAGECAREYMIGDNNMAQGVTDVLVQRPTMADKLTRWLYDWSKLKEAGYNSKQ